MKTTYVDGFLDLGNKAFIFYKFYLEGESIPRGQKLALTRLIDSLTESGKNAILFICRHNVINPEEDIDAAKAVVDKFYWNKNWHKGNGNTVKDFTNRFMNWVETL